MTATALEVQPLFESSRLMPDRREGKLIEPRFMAQTLIMVALSGASSFYASYQGSRIEAAVAGKTISRIETAVDDLVKQQAGLVGSITASRLDSTRETTRLQAELAAQAKEVDDLKSAVYQKDKDLSDAIRLQDLQIINFGKSIATIQGELNAERRTKRE